MKDAEWLGWTAMGVAAIVLVYFLVNFIYMNVHQDREKKHQVKIEKLQTCRTVQDEALRTLCIVQGGAQ